MAQPKVQFFFLSVAVTIKNRSSLKRFIEFIFKREETPISQVNYIFCTDSYLRGLNTQYLKHSFFTDIITFDLSEKAGKVYGEIYISIDRVKENAKQLTIPFQQELHRVVFHGALHLCGYDDKTNKEISLIRKKEDFYLKRFFK